MRILSSKALRAAVMSGAIGLGGMVAVAPASMAAVGDCDSGDACIWRDHDYQTAGYGRGWLAFEFYVPNLSQWWYNGFPHIADYSANNSATSIYNNGNELRACFYDGYDYSVLIKCLPIKSGRNNLLTSLDPLGKNDKISSARFEE